MVKSKWIMGLMALTLAVSLSACGNKKEETNNGTTTGNNETTGNTSGGTVDAAAAETVYKANCISCHAVDLAGGIGPNLQKVGGKLSVADITKRIDEGGGGMPAFKGTLSDTDIANLAGWLGSMK
ncbi:cytochrome c [Paenibacillus sp. PR3]|uniref:Cytochrome c n=1 Tax=Paenibacillus terricola TaxID=2763503 RepID=A0ABR8MTE7_9BACL|nr:cytochrome c [Paenibacillus terricola]MBD3919232.1 cytochrome c [Paenibacillus terricola]